MQPIIVNDGAYVEHSYPLASSMTADNANHIPPNLVDPRISQLLHEQDVFIDDLRKIQSRLDKHEKDIYSGLHLIYDMSEDNGIITLKVNNGNPIVIDMNKLVNRNDDIEMVKDMKVITVTFGSNPKMYEYLTDLDLIIGATYHIIADNITGYSTPVTVHSISNTAHFKQLRTITHATLVSAPARPNDNIKLVNFNKDKGTTVVVWADGTKTIVKCQPEDVFDPEKAIALCYMKRFFGNRGCFNEVFKKYIPAELLEEYLEDIDR